MPRLFWKNNEVSWNFLDTFRLWLFLRELFFKLKNCFILKMVVLYVVYSIFPMVKIGKRDSNTSADVGGLWAGPENLFKKGSDFGFFFESSWVKQLRGVGLIYLCMKEDFCLWPVILHIVFFFFVLARRIRSILTFSDQKFCPMDWWWLMCISNFPQVSWYIICINQYIVYTLIFIIVIFVCN